MLILFFFGGFFNSFSQLGGPEEGPSLRLVFYDSIAGSKVVFDGNLSRQFQGRLLLEADPNDILAKSYDTQLLIEVIHARGRSVLTTIPLTGLKEFRRVDVLKTLRPALQEGDRIVLTYKMMSEAQPSAFIIKIL